MDEDLLNRSGAPRLVGVVGGLSLLLAVSALSLYPILSHQALPWGSDTAFHLQLADGFGKGLRDGHLWPRWLSEANRGFGSSALISYPPLSAYVVALVGFLTQDAVQATQLVLILSTVAAGLSFYLCARTFAPPIPSLLGALLYLLAPYRAVDVHSRFAFAEIGTFVWLPLLLRFVHGFARGRSYAAWIGFALVCTGLLLTHIITAFIAFLTLGPYLLWLTLRDRDWRTFGGLGLAAVAGAALAGVYVVPVVYERGWSHAEYLIEAWWGNWRRNMLYVDEVALGYRESVIGQIVERSFLLTSLAALGGFVASARSGGGDRTRFAVFSLLTAFVQLPLSAFLWRLIPATEYIQFPWRFQTLLSLFACLLMVKALSRQDFLPGLLAALTAVLWLGFSGFLWQRVSYTVDGDLFARMNVPRQVMKEHIPQGVVNWDKFDRIQPLDQPRVRADPDADVTVAEWSSHRRRLQVRADERTRLTLRTFYYPGWVAKVDGKNKQIRPMRPFRSISFIVPRGRHDVEIRFEETPDRLAGSVVSILAATMLVSSALLQIRRSKRAAP